MNEVNYGLVLLASFLAGASPGPATLAIAGTSMRYGRRYGAILALGISTGSVFWSASAALGMSAMMMSQTWLMEWVRYLGAAYLLFLGYKSARSAIKKPTPYAAIEDVSAKGWSLYMKGAFIHLTNPKAILFFGSLYAVAVPMGTSIANIALLNVLIVGQGFIIFQGYAFLFARPKIRERYFALSRWFDSAFAFVFGAAGASLLLAKLKLTVN